jgi:TatD DNase family protein
VTEAERYLDLGFYISFTGALAFPPKKGQEENALAPVCRLIPVNRLLIETDAPWLTPPPFRGERNDPSKVCLTAKAVARVRRTDLAEIEKITTANAIHLFNLAEPS